MQKSIKEVFERVSNCFVWRSDRDTRGVGEYWDHFADSVRAGKVEERDCEDYGITNLIIGIEDYAWDIDKCRLARVLTPQGDRTKPFDHCIAIYDGWVLDNRQSSPVRLEDTDYYFYDYTGIPMTDWFLYESGQQFLQKGHH